MIATQKPRTVKTEGIQNTVSFGIKESGIAHIFNVLRNQLYTDKVTAVIREYSTNAADAHVEAGCADRPIEVTLPSRFNLQFSVRDFGLALSDKEIQDIYAFYGESTKRNTNEQTGMLGIGSKSAFAYGDNFVINSYLDGSKHTYNAFIDDSQVGQISKLSVEDTDEENGVEIVIPVRMDDVDEFEKKAQTLFRYFKTKPILNGKKLDYEEGEVLYSGNGWRFLDSSVSSRWDRGEAIVVMGNIGYPIDSDQLKLGDDSTMTNFVCRNLVLECKIGDLEISASREGLQYTDYTIKHINAKLREAAKEIAEKISQHFSQCKTLWEARTLASEMFRYDGKLYAVQSLCKDAKWKGRPIGETSLRIDDESEHYDVFSYSSTYRANQKVRAQKAPRVEAGDKTLIVLNDQSHRRGVMAKMVHQVDNEGKTPYLFTFRKNTTKLQKEGILKKLGLVTKDFAKLKDLPEAKLDGRYASVSSGSNSKHSSKVFLPKDGSRGGWRTDPQSSYWTASSVDLKTEKVLYVALERFMYRDSQGRILDSRRFPEAIEKFAELGLLDDYDGKVYGVKIAEEHKFKSSANATEAWDYLKSKLQEAIEEADISTEAANIKALDNVENCWEVMSKHIKLFKSDTILKQFIVEIAKARVTKGKVDDDDGKQSSKIKTYKVLKDLAYTLNMELPVGTATFNPDIAKTLLDMYPLLKLAKENIRYCYHDDSKEEDKVQLIADYVELVNNSPSE